MVEYFCNIMVIEVIFNNKTQIYLFSNQFIFLKRKIKCGYIIGRIFNLNFNVWMHIKVVHFLYHSAHFAECPFFGQLEQTIKLIKLKIWNWLYINNLIMIEIKASCWIPFQIIYRDSKYGVTSNNKFLCGSFPSKIIIKLSLGIFEWSKLSHIFISP